LLGAFDRTQRKGVIMSRISRSHIAVLLAIGAIVPMPSLVSRPGLAETLGNANAPGLAAIAISDLRRRLCRRGCSHGHCNRH
jgi:hypothetical protein